MLNTAFFIKISFNYTRPQPDKLVKSNINYNGFFEIFLKSFSERGLNQIKNRSVKLIKIKKKTYLFTVRPYQVSVLKIKYNI